MPKVVFSESNNTKQKIKKQISFIKLILLMIIIFSSFQIGRQYFFFKSIGYQYEQLSIYYNEILNNYEYKVNLRDNLESRLLEKGVVIKDGKIREFNIHYVPQTKEETDRESD